jgi:GAF domain-containing protein
VADPEDLSATMLAVATTLLSEESLDVTLQRIVDAVVEAVPGCDHAGLSLLRAGRITTAAASDGRTLQLDGSQYVYGEGPCLEAFETSTVVMVDDSPSDSRYPQFALDVERAGVKSSLSVPLGLAGERFGVMNLYADEPAAFHSGRRAAEVFASHASAVIANAQALHRAKSMALQLGEALETRAVIEQAKGVLMARERCDADAAFDILRRASQRENRKLRDVAADVVAAVRAEHD